MTDKEKKRSPRKKLKSILASVLSFSLIFTNLITAYADEDLQISIRPNPDIDVVLTVGNTTWNVSNFATDLKGRLSSRGIDASKVNVQAVETKEMNAQDTFNWQIYDHINYQEPYGGTRYNHIVVQNKDIIFYGYTAPAFKDFMFMPDNNPGKKTFTFDFSENNTDWHTLEGGGFLFNAKIENNKVYGYVVLWGQSNVILDELMGVDLNSLRNGTYNQLSQAGRQLATFSRLQTPNHNVRIEVTPTTINMWDNGTKIINNYTLPNQYASGFGPFASYLSHGCSVISYFTFKNILMQTEVVKQFKDVIRQPQWRDGSERFVVNLEDQTVSDFDHPQYSGEILTRLINEEIAYVALGTSSNQAQALNFIARNNGNGTFINNSNYNNAMNQLADYIASKVQSRSSNSSQYVLIGEPVNIEVIPPHLRTNTQTPEYPQGRWRVDHDYTYFENNLGQAANSGQYQKDLQLVFDKPGRYELWFADKHPDPRYIYVHRRPVADFSLNVQANGSNYTVTVTDRSYDPDYQSQADRGIAQYEWKWRETSSQTWNNGMIPSTLPQGKDYIIQLRVKDKQGVWSQPESRYITTSSVVVKPVASFEMPAQATRYQTIVVSDTSYDPAGRPITSRQWVVKKNGTQVYSGSSPITNFNSYGEGTYEVILKVQNNAGLWSEEFKRTIVITGDNVKPDAIFDKTRQDWTNQNITVNITFSDDGGSGFNSQRYAVTNSPTFPTSGWSAWDNKTTRTITITNEGRWYIHIEAKDNAGNLMQRTMGEYQIDKTPPSAPTFALSNSNPTNQDISLTINYPSDAVQKQYQIGDGGVWADYTNPLTISNNVKVNARAIDIAGNVSAVSSINITNIDKTPPAAPTFSPSTTNPTNQDVLLTINYPSDAAQKQYRIGESGQWTNYSGAISISSNTTVYARAIDAVGNVSTVSSINITNIDKTPPADPILVADKTNPTNQDVKVTITYPSDAVIKEYKVDNGSWTTYTAPVVMTQNGTVFARAIDAAGNVSNVTSYTVSNIDKVPPEAPTLVADKTKPTNTDVTVTITYPSDAVTKEYKVDNGAWQAYTTPIVMKQDGIVYARAIDVAGNISQVNSYKVDIIDKVPPTAPKIVQNVDTISLVPGTDDRNGIADTQIRINGGEWKSYTAPIQLADGEYTIEAKSIDGVGNETVATLHTYVYDDTLREAERLVGIAEKFPFPVQSKIDEAKAVVDLLPDVAPEKQGLLDRLKKLQDILDENWIENELNEISRKIDSGNPTPEQLQEWKNKLQEYKNIVNDMFEGEKKQELLDRIDELLDKIAVLEEFLRVGTPKTVEEIDRLQDLVDTLPDGLLKDRLQKQLDNAKDVISRAVEAVEKAEQTLSKIDYDKAMKLVNQVQDENVRQELLDRLDAISEIVHVVGLVEKAEQTKKQEDVNTAREAVNGLPDGELKTELTNRLDKIDKDLANAINLVETAEKTLNPSTVNRAEEAVNKLIDMPKKQELIDRLEAVKDLIASKQAQDQLANAIKAVEKAEQFKREPYISIAFDAVNALPDSDIKTQLLDRLNALLQQIEDERKAKEDAKKDDQLKKLIEEATKKVEQAEKYKREPYLKNAYDAVNALPDGEAKDALKARLDAIKAELENKEPPKDPAQVELEKKIADATKKVELAEQFKREPYIKNAEDAVNALPEGAVKDALKARLDALKRALEDEALAKLYQEAERKVSLAEKYKREPYISDAYNAVNALPDGAKKDELKTRLDAIRIDDGDEGSQDPDTNEELEKIKDPVVKMLFLDLIKAVERAEKYFSKANIVYAMEKINAIPADVQNNPLYKPLFDNLNSRVDALKQTYNAVIADQELELLIKKAETAVETFERFRSAALKEKAQKAVDALTEPNIKERLQARIDAVVVKQ